MEAHRDSPLPHPESTTNDDKVKTLNTLPLVFVLITDSLRSFHDTCSVYMIGNLQWILPIQWYDYLCNKCLDLW